MRLCRREAEGGDDDALLDREGLPAACARVRVRGRVRGRVRVRVRVRVRFRLRLRLRVRVRVSSLRGPW